MIVSFLMGVVFGVVVSYFLSKFVVKYATKNQIYASIAYDKEKEKFVVRGSLDKIFDRYRARRFDKPGAIKYID